MHSPNLNERCSSSLSASHSKKVLSVDSKEESFDNSARESLNDRSSKSEEDWRRRTIIIEKKNGSYGFTLQSYGIHYKKEQEVEVITYVDFVDKQGPAAAAGMREGDVILSINGIDVERADHQTIVDTVTSCDSRMRMVVIFEDCVRKVELHIKYINLQRIIQDKVKELDKLKIKERHILDANWKTHSLPSQKKKNSPGDQTSDTEDTAGESSYARPTLSSENVANIPNPQVSLKYHYLDHRYSAYVIQPNMRTGNFVITVGSPRTKADCRHYVVKNHNESHRRIEEKRKDSTTNGYYPQAHKSGHKHGCTQCIPPYNNHDANSLDAYDLASPCCDPHCVPSARKNNRRKRESSKEKRRDRTSNQTDRSYQKSENSHARKNKPCSSINCPGSRYRYLNNDSTQTSQCSLQSYNNSSGTATGANQKCDNSNSSYTTSLSSDTLFWENDRSERKTSPKIQYQQAHQPHYKPKSWDNLTTKVIGGYGFGYGYLDTITKHVTRSKSHGRSHTSRSTQSHHGYHSQPHRQNTVPPQHYNVYEQDHRHCPAPTKSSESLTHNHGSENRIICKWVDGPGTPNGQVEYYRRSSAPKSPNDSRSSGYYSHHFVYPNHTYQKKEPNVSSEVTRL